VTADSVRPERRLSLRGEVLPESAARISPFDRGFLWGDGVYEVTPLFEGRLFHLDDHIERMYRSLRYVQIDPGLTVAEMRQATLDVVEANRALCGPGTVFRLGHWISRGEDAPSMLASDAGVATVMIALRPVDVASVARNQREGVTLAVTATRRVPPESIEARAKITSKMNQTLAELDAAAHGAMSLMLDLQGNVAENSIANFFIVRDGAIIGPPDRNVLQGVTRKTIGAMAARLGIPIVEQDLTMYDIAQADECLLSSSGFGVYPVRAVDRFIPKAPVPGPVAMQLLDAFAEESGFDYRTAADAQR
jgi:branched-chain amino acid aminotransferase